MGRIRTIKPDFFRHEEMYQAELKCGLPLRLAFIGLLTCCDRDGRFRYKPNVLKLDIMPFDDIDFTQVLHQLCVFNFIICYEVEQEMYGCIPNFLKHQTINVREAESKIPDLSMGLQINMETHVHARANICMHTGNRNRKGKRKGNGLKEPNGSLSSSHSTAHNLINNEAIQVLEFLNEKAQRFYRPTETNLKLISARLAEGMTAQNLRSIIAKKLREWGDNPEMAMYLRPKTLFSRTNCEQYYGELSHQYSVKSTEKMEETGVLEDEEMSKMPWDIPGK